MPILAAGYNYYSTDTLMDNFIVSLFVTITIYTLPVLIYRYGIKKEPISPKSGKIFTIVWAILGFFIMSMLLALLNGSIASGGGLILWSFVNYKILTKDYGPAEEDKIKPTFDNKLPDHRPNSEKLQAAFEKTENKDAFSGGFSQAVRVAASLRLLFGLHTKEITESVYSELLSVYLYVVTRRDDLSASIIQSKFRHFIKTRDIAKNTLTYCLRNMKDPTFLLRSKADIENLQKPEPIVQPTAPKIQFCRKCGVHLIEGANFCVKCGATVNKGD